MKSCIIDIEVEKNWKDFPYRPEPWELGFFCSVLWDFENDMFLFFDDKNKFIKRLRKYDLIIGHNILRFDIPLLEGARPHIIRFNDPFIHIRTSILGDSTVLDTLLGLAAIKNRSNLRKVLSEKGFLSGLSLDRLGPLIGMSKVTMREDQNSTHTWGDPRYCFQRALQDVRIVKRILEVWGINIRKECPLKDEVFGGKVSINLS